MPKQTITITLDVPEGKEPYTGIEKHGPEGEQHDYLALHDFFEGLEYAKPTIDFGLDESGDIKPQHHLGVAFFNQLMERAKVVCKLRLAVDPKCMDGADETDLDSITELDDYGATFRYRYWDGCHCHGSTQDGTVYISLSDLFIDDFEQVKARLEKEAAEAQARAKVEQAQRVEQERLAAIRRDKAELARLQKKLGVS